MFSDQANPEYWSEEAMTFNHHKYGLSTEIFSEDAGLGSIFVPTSTSTDPVSGDTFVATMESPTYPFFGT